MSSLTIHARSQVERAPEDLGQMALIGESTFGGDHCQGQIRLLQQLFCSLDPLAEHELVGAFTGRLAELASEVRSAQAHVLGQHRQGKILIEVGQQEIDQVFQLGG